MMASSVSVTSTSRVIALVDMDCFYVQVEERDDPSIKGVPAAVVQYKTFKGGGIIAVNYEARAKGVTRQMRGDDAKGVCPEIRLVRVPETRGKADLTKYRDAGREVIKVLTDFSSCVERASIDEAYIDLTEAVEVRLAEISSEDLFVSWGENILQSLNMECLATNFVMGYESTQQWLEALKGSEIPSMDDIRLAIGAEIVGKMREAVYKKTGFRCSAGIAHNKVIAKLCCGINKPNKQTVLPHSSVPSLWSTTKIGKVRGLGGKLGDYLKEKLGCNMMADLGRFTEKELGSELGSKTGIWLYQLSLGYDDEAVTPRQLPKSIGCNKNFFGPEALKTKEKVKFWINQLAAEVVERVQRDLEMNNRRAKTLTLHVKFEDQSPLSRSCGANPQYNPERMAADAYGIMEKLFQTLGVLPVNSLGLIASKFEDEIDTSSYAKINDFFKSKPPPSSTIVSESLTLGDSEDSNDSSEKHLETNSSKPQSNPSNSISSSTAASSTIKSTEPTNTTTKVVLHSLPSKVNTASTSKSLLDKSLQPIANNTKDDKLVSNSSSMHPPVTPKKSEPSEKCDVRKPFFKFCDSAPISPRKSPRKLTATAVQSEQDPTKFKKMAVASEQECERCGKKLSVREFTSHMDYHFAKDLSREINGLPPLDFDLRPETLRKKAEAESAAERARAAQKRPRGRGGSTSGSKRGRGSKSATTSSSSKSQPRTIDSYFGPKS